MQTVKIKTSDTIIWNRDQVYADIAVAMANDQPLTLDLLGEGPCWHSLAIEPDIIGLASQFNYDLNKVIVLTSNAVKTESQLHFQFTGMQHLVDLSKVNFPPQNKVSNIVPFGMFVGRSNAPRLWLASYLEEHYSAKSILTYHLNQQVEFHRDNIGLEDLYQTFGIKNIAQCAKFIETCPRLLPGNDVVQIDSNSLHNPANQFMKADQTQLVDQYPKFLVEIVGETYYTGQTFFVTEKTWRPILLKTPFIVQGPQWFLRNLKKLGFMTFDQWWDEGYSEDPSTHQICEIARVIDYLACKTPQQLQAMYEEMRDILEYNYVIFESLIASDFSGLYGRI